MSNENMNNNFDTVEAENISKSIDSITESLESIYKRVYRNQVKNGGYQISTFMFGLRMVALQGRMNSWMKSINEEIEGVPTRENVQWG
jgi:hypothetical protein